MTAARKAQSDTVALFVSDVHLQPSLPRTTQAFLDFLGQHATKAQQLYVLGDLFEYWAGDDDLAEPYHRQIAEALRALDLAGVALFWIPGNRDFLIGNAFAAATGMRLLPDPYIAEIAGVRIALTHGDAQCTDDHGYMAFRAQVRQQQWQAQFLAQPLAQRKAIIEGMRSGSREAQRAKAYDIMDVNPAAIAALFEETNADVLIHGHTHRPATHRLEAGGRMRVRHVLPDWECDAEAPRGGWLALDGTGNVTRFSYDGRTL
ncbi:MAG TPA: UDP-2,3-diacylglucosamine diphosphatase [Noviherbaspirillum sp.]|uniref:UDP-2,3-diacylglucosamine diphosphatase n=1 Tax=Noviherbaspirillum sp. TaxID=1926288 RepID=UPI002D57811B|nr:UDP-2,3-diacylglucosamine diphosphatase [Noviherbaspirillum sp.]HYD96921.1 UDP-2,3-diacylglucosamine diphosphatase [Noviherbaspirillum sp.]